MYTSRCCCLVSQSCLTLCHPMDCGPPGSSVHGILQIRTLDGLPFPSPGDLSYPGIEPLSPALQADSFLLEPSGKPQQAVYLHIKADQTDLNRELNQEWKKQKHILITVARWSWSDPQKWKQAKLRIHCIKYSAGWMDRKKIWEWRLFLTVRSPGVLCCPKCIFIFGFLYFIFSNILSSPIDNYQIRSRVSPEGNEDTAIPSRHTEDSMLNHTVLCPCGHLPVALGFQGRRLRDPQIFWQEAKGKLKIVIQKYGLILAFS